MLPWVCAVAKWIKIKMYYNLDEYIIGLLSVSALQKAIASNIGTGICLGLFGSLSVEDA
jgi:hypothetical protein